MAFASSTDFADQTPINGGGLEGEAPPPGLSLPPARAWGSERPTRWETWLRVGIVIVAAAFRLWALDLRPPHFDEGVNGMFTDQMRHTGFYAYDPKNYHGPLHFYILFLFKCVMGRSLWALRLPEALAGIATVAGVYRFDRFFGRRVCIWAALAMAVSPGFTFFNRYAIHETWLVLFMLLVFWGLLALWREGTRGGLWAVGMGLAGMILIKETYVIHLACLAVAGGCRWLVRLGQGGQAPKPAPQRWRWWDGLLVAGVGMVVIGAFYSGFGLNPAGLMGLATTFAPWMHKAQVGEGHSKPFVYWSLVFVHNEPWVLAGLALSVRYIVAPSRWGEQMRVLALYAVAVFLAYSIIPYKTPWCIISIAWPFLFLAAAAVVEVEAVAGLDGRGVGLLAGAALTAWSSWLAWDLNFRRCTDEKEEYVYVHTYDSVREITGPLLKLAHENPANYGIKGVVLCSSVHPLPWLLGDFTNVAYWTNKRKPAAFDDDFLLVSADRTSEVEAGLHGNYYKEKVRLRPGLGPLYLYLRAPLFAHLLPGRQPEFTEHKVLSP